MPEANRGRAVRLFLSILALALRKWSFCKVNPRLSAAASLLFAPIWCALAADGRISGRITDTTDKPVAGAKLFLAPETGGATNEVTSDAEGGFAFSSLPQGDYQITATAAGFIDAKAHPPVKQEHIRSAKPNKSTD